MLYYILYYFNKHHAQLHYHYLGISQRKNIYILLYSDLQTKDFISPVVISIKNKLDVPKSNHYILLNLSETKYSFKPM